MQSVLVSACLLGEAVRYDGLSKPCPHKILTRWLEEGRVVRVCPEVSGGLSIPRTPAEIDKPLGGFGVLSGKARVVDNTGRDVTAAFMQGAREALAVAQARGIRVAVLKENSPSCGSSSCYDGTFTRTRIPEPGVTGALLKKAGVLVFSEEQFEEADEALRGFEVG